MRGVAPALVAISLLAAAPAAAAPTTDPNRDPDHRLRRVEPDYVLHHPKGRSKGTILLAHPGAFFWGAASMMKTVAHRYRGAGYDVRSLGYPLRDYRGAVRYAAQSARYARRSGKPVLMVGESVGGSLAVALAARGLVDAAVVVAAPTDFTRWGDTGYLANIGVHNRARSSPARGLGNKGDAPVLAFHSPADRVVPFSQSRSLDRRRGVVVRRLGGNHLEDQRWVRRSRRWLDARTLAHPLE